VDPGVERALAALDEAERVERQAPGRDLDPEYARDIAAVMARPENQDGADKSGRWAIHEFCWRHFANARPG